MKALDQQMLESYVVNFCLRVAAVAAMGRHRCRRADADHRGVPLPRLLGVQLPIPFRYASLQSPEGTFPRVYFSYAGSNSSSTFALSSLLPLAITPSFVYHCGRSLHRTHLRLRLHESSGERPEKGRKSDSRLRGKNVVASPTRSIFIIAR